MSWLDKIDRLFKHSCTACNCKFKVKTTSKEKIPPDLACPVCKSLDLEYLGWENDGKIGVSHAVLKEEYEQNGRKAYRIGNTYISKTKYDYMETGEINNQYTPGFEAHLAKEAEKNEYLLKTEMNQNRANVSKVDPVTHQEQAIKNAVRDLPDGEHIISVENTQT